MKKYLLFILIISNIAYAQITFDASFPSGNLGTVSTTDSINYTVSTISDIGGRWFYFRISDVKNKFIRVEIPTSDVNRPMYSYDDRNYQRFTSSEAPRTNMFQKTFVEDTVFVAYYTPYNFSFLQERIMQWSQSEFVDVDTIGTTPLAFPMQEIRITDPTIPDSGKHRVWIHARTHPGETPSSWHFDGIIETLLKNNPVIDRYRKNIIFHCIPFTNPEGVFFGRSRTNYNGVDVESAWSQPDDQTIEEVKILKKRMAEINSDKILSVFLNLHSQASPYCTFWVHTASSTSNKFYLDEVFFANIQMSDIPYFYPDDLRFSNLRDVFPEGWLWDNHGDKVMALTYETPYDRYSSNIWVSNENLAQIGQRTVYGIGEYLGIHHPYHFIIDTDKATTNGDWNVIASSEQMFGADVLSANSGEGEASILYQTDTIPPGTYDIFGWWPYRSENASDVDYIFSTESGFWQTTQPQNQTGREWAKIRTISLTTESTVSISFDNNTNGKVFADAFRFIRTGDPSDVQDEEIKRPETFVLHQNYPNPFNPTTTISFDLKKNTEVRLIVYDAIGNMITELVNGELSAGNHSVYFNALDHRSLSSGVYYYRLVTPEYAKTRGMILMK